ncbi:MAG: hypothetical protein OXD01_00530, partial [Gammaproteobacteria bacterium]|nr:hypothetical protein [Gammaproteobacteria bacterium]
GCPLAHINQGFQNNATASDVTDTAQHCPDGMISKSLHNSLPSLNPQPSQVRRRVKGFNLQYA